MSFRLRLQLTALATLVVGLGAVLVAGNVLLDQRVDHEATSLLRLAPTRRSRRSP
jgi:hypothetical protein